MALKTLFGKGASSASTSKEYTVANRLTENETVEGYLMGFGTHSFQLKTGKNVDKRVILLQREDGTIFKLSADGNLKYLEQDIEKRGITIGAFTVITRTGTKTTNFGPSGLFSVAQDPEKTTTVSKTSASSNAATTMEEKIERAKQNSKK